MGNINKQPLPLVLRVFLILHAILLGLFGILMIFTPLPFMKMWNAEVESPTFIRVLSGFFFAIVVHSIITFTQNTKYVLFYLYPLITLNAVISLGFFISMVDTEDSLTYENFILLTISTCFLVIWISSLAYLTDKKNKSII